MRVAVTGATGFVGRYIVAELFRDGHELRCWFREESDRAGFHDMESALQWVPGRLGAEETAHPLVQGCDAVVHAALWRPGKTFRGGEGDILTFVHTNLVGTLQLIEAARRAGAGRFIFISTCAVHERILDDRPLDETHPLWPTTHYGAHKAAIEKFVHSYGLGLGYPICALRPTGVYGRAQPVADSKWFDLVRAVARGEAVTCRGGGKEVHAADVARAVALLLKVDQQQLAGQAFACYDQYVSQYDVAQLARQITGSGSEIHGQQTRPRHQIVTDKIRALGMQFGGQQLLQQTIAELAERAGA